jgi:hypothetical protein
MVYVLVVDPASKDGFLYLMWKTIKALIYYIEMELWLWGKFIVITMLRDMFYMNLI